MDRKKDYELVQMQVKSDNNAIADYTAAEPIIPSAETSNDHEDQTRPFLASEQKQDGPYRDSIHIAERNVIDISLLNERQRGRRRYRYLLSACLGWLCLVTVIVSFQWTGRSPTRATTWLDGNEKKALVLSTIMKTDVTWLSDIDSE
jgi:hypothetical protein